MKMLKKKKKGDRPKPTPVAGPGASAQNGACAGAIAANLEIRFTSFWISGRGTAGGRFSDVIAHRDEWDCPAMPMSQVKGQLRESAERLAALGAGGWGAAAVRQIFGAQDTLAGDVAFPGEARLPGDLRAWLAVDKSKRSELFRRIASTRVDGNGVAQDQTLRAIEAAVPVTLTAQLFWRGEQTPKSDWVALLDHAAAATLAFGKLKQDGYGRAIATITAGTGK